MEESDQPEEMGRDGKYEIMDAIDAVFNLILRGFSQIDAFSKPGSPSIFIVYAHENGEKGTANAEYVHLMIQWLRTVGARILSDKSPLLPWAVREGESASARNILSNQFCLLPGGNSNLQGGIIESASKIVLCSSELLEEYYMDDFTSPYVESIERLYNANFQGRSELKTCIRSFVESQCGEKGFHHVLTELAFLKIRASENQDTHGIIPIVLNGNGVKYLPFIQPTELFIAIEPSQGYTHLHRPFFKLLRRLHPEQDQMIECFQSCYGTITRALKQNNQENDLITKEKFRNIVWPKIFEVQDALIQKGHKTIRNLNITSPQMDQELDLARRKHKRTKLLASLSTLSYTDRKDRNPKRVEGTCLWFINHPLFLAWKQNPRPAMLWVSADPGSGKSVLARHLVDDVLKSTSTTTTCYFFFKDDFEDQKSIESAMRCLLHQLFLANPELMSDDILDQFEKTAQRGQSFMDLWSTFVRVASMREAPKIICILDALDECEQGGRSRFIEALQGFSEAHGNRANLKFLLTSRPYIIIQRDFQLLTTQQSVVHLSGETEEEVLKISQEVDLVIRAKLEDIKQRLQLNDNQMGILLAELTRNPNRSYLWVCLIFPVIEDSVGTTDEDLRENVQEIPQTVKDAYEKILSRSRNTRKAQRLLHIVLAAESALTLREMAVALAIRGNLGSHHQLQVEPEDRFRTTIRELCGLFITIVDDRIYLIHQTAREFLIGDGPAGSSSDVKTTAFKWQGSCLPAQSHAVLAEICIWYLPVGLDSLSVSDHSSPDTARPPEFLSYVEKFWPGHFQQASGHHNENLIHRAAQLCDVTHGAYLKWFEPYYHKQYDANDKLLTLETFHVETLPEGLTPLMVACLLGLPEVISLLLQEKKPQLDSRDKTYKRTPLMWACIGGHEEAIKLILDQCSSGRFRRVFKATTIHQKDVHGNTPLALAVMHATDASVRLLLKNGADCNAFTYSGEPDSKGVMRLLYRAGMSLLAAAAFRGSEEITNTLLEKGARMKPPATLPSMTPLSLAVWKGHEHVVNLLLKKGANPNLLIDHSRLFTTVANSRVYNLVSSFSFPLLYRNAFLLELHTPLAYAIEMDFESIALRLIEYGANVNDTWSNVIPLFLAIRVGNEKVLRLLLSRGANVNAVDDQGRTALFMIGPGDETITQLLLDGGADINAVDSSGRTVLFYATDKAITEFLLDRGAQTHIIDSEGQTVLFEAVREGNRDIVELFLDRGVDIHAVDSSGMTALFYVTDRAMTEFLLDRGAQTHIIDSGGQTVLFEAVREGNRDIVELFLDRGVDIHIADSEGETVLFDAVRIGNRDIVELLLDRGAGVNFTNRQGQTVLFQATKEGFQDIAELLQDRE